MSKVVVGPQSAATLTWTREETFFILNPYHMAQLIEARLFVTTANIKTNIFLIILKLKISEVSLKNHQDFLCAIQ